MVYIVKPPARRAGRVMETTLHDTTIDLGRWQITADGVREYLDAVGDSLPAYLETGTAPPLMLTARVVGRLLERLSLPDGAIHSLQDVTTLAPPSIGIEVSATAQVEPIRERSGLQFLTVNYSVSDANGGPTLQQGKTTVLLPSVSDDDDDDKDGNGNDGR